MSVAVASRPPARARTLTLPAARAVTVVVAPVAGVNEARDASLAASERVVEQLGGALERTLTALEPYLLQLRLEMGAANA